jgi:ATP-dependent Clp protease ATP-binding subunit ClpC
VLRLEEDLGTRVVGHPTVVERVARAVRRNFAGFSGQRPLASFIFLGPTGVGKTELARSLADVVFGGGSALVRLDMSEFSEGHAVAKLVGAPPGYVGYGEGGQLTEAVRRTPACVVLLDEIEKAHRDAQQVVLQLLDEGHLTDSRGRRVDFTNAIVVLTSNLGAEAFDGRAGRAVGFGSRGDAAEDRTARALALARESFPPELWNRIEERLVFQPLERPDLRRIARLLAARSSARLAEDKRIRYELDDSAVEHLLDNGGHDPTLGARPMRQALSRLVEGPLAERILRGEVSGGDRVRVLVRGKRLDFELLTVVDPRLQ